MFYASLLCKTQSCLNLQLSCKTNEITKLLFICNYIFISTCVRCLGDKVFVAAVFHAHTYKQLMMFLSVHIECPWCFRVLSKYSHTSLIVHELNRADLFPVSVDLMHYAFTLHICGPWSMFPCFVLFICLFVCFFNFTPCDPVGVIPPQVQHPH